METAMEVTKNLVEAPPATLTLLVVLAAIALAIFAVYVVHKNINRKP